MNHAVQFVSEDEWATTGRTHLFVRTKDGDLLLFFREGAVTEQVLEDAWADYREIRQLHDLDNAEMQQAVTRGIEGH